MYNFKQYLMLLVYVGSSFGELKKIKDPRVSARDSLTLCTVKITQNYFKDNDIVTVLLSTSHNVQYSIKSAFPSLLLGFLHKQKKWSIFVRKNKKNNENFAYYKKSHIYIMHIGNAIELQDGIPFLKDKAWNPQAKFIIISTTIFRNKTAVISDIIERLWKQKGLKIIFLFPQDNNKETFDIYTWLPFQNGNCANRFDEISIIDQCTSGQFLKNGTLFPEVIPLNLHQCPIKIETVIWPPYVVAPENGENFTKGIEIMLMNNIAKIANFSVVYSISNKTLNWGALDYKGQTTGLFKSLMDEKVDLVLSSLAATPIRYIMLEPSIPYTSESITWCVPTPDFKPKWMNIFQTFNMPIWLLILISYLLISSFYYCVSNYSISDTLLLILAMLLNISSKKPTTNVIRILFLHWAMFTLTITALYQSKLFKILIQPVRENQITNVKQLADDPMKVGTFYIWWEYFNVTTNENEQKLNEKWIDCDDIDQCLYNIAYYKNYSMATPRVFVSYNSNNYTDSSGRSLVYLFKKNSVTYPVQIYGYKGFPFMKRINNIISNLYQTGIHGKWETDITTSVEKYNKNNIKGKGHNHLGLQQFEGAFIVYLISIVISIVVFVLELILFKLNMKCKL